MKGYIKRNIGFHFFEVGDEKGLINLLTSSNENIILFLEGTISAIRHNLHESNKLKYESSSIKTLGLMANSGSTLIAESLVELVEYTYNEVGGWTMYYLADIIKDKVHLCSRSIQLHGYTRLSMIESVRGENECSSNYIKKATKIAMESPEDPISSFVLTQYAWYCPPYESLVQCKKACKFAEISQDHIAFWEAWANKSSHLRYLWQFNDAIEAAEILVKQLDKNDRSFRLTDAWNILCQAKMRAGLMLGAAEAGFKATDYFKYVGKLPMNLTMGYILELIGVLDDYNKIKDKLYLVSNNIKEAHGVDYLRFVCPLFRLSIENMDDEMSEKLCIEIKDFIKDYGTGPWWFRELYAYQLIARYYFIIKGNKKFGENWLNKANKIHRKYKIEPYEMVSYYYEAEYNDISGNYGKAEKLAIYAYKLIEKFGAGGLAPFVSKLLVRIYSEKQDEKLLKKWEKKYNDDISVWRIKESKAVLQKIDLSVIEAN